VLTIGASDSCLKPLGNIDASNVPRGSWLVIFNAGEGYPGANYYEFGGVTGGNKSQITLAANGKIDFDAHAFTWDSPSRRFFIATSPVSYACDPVAKTLRRWTGYSPQASQPTVGLASLDGATSAMLGRNLKSCQISYAPASIANQFGLVTLTVNFGTPSGDNMILQTQVQVSNLP
jgi:MSHA biogenesis protein MshO